MQEYNSKHVPQLFIDIAQAMGLEDPGEDASKAVKLVLGRIRSPSALKALNLKP